MKILVGIMYCIENEFEQCKEAIRRQTYTNWELFTIKNLPNKEAHDTLYQTFMNRAAEFDLFIKIDADMVLCRDTFFEEVVSIMENESNTDHLLFKVQDFFTNRLIFGLHVYKSTVKFKKNNDRYSVDLTAQFKNAKIFGSEKSPYNPAAFHCPDPSVFQAFHFGLHKAAKVIQVDREAKNTNTAVRHAINIVHLFLNQEDDSNKKENLLYAQLGVIWALETKISHKEVDFSSAVTSRSFIKNKEFSIEEKETLVNNWKHKNITNIPKRLGPHYFIVGRYFFRQNRSGAYLYTIILKGKEVLRKLKL